MHLDQESNHGELSPHSPEAGFSLIQVLVSVAIMSLCIGLFFQARNSAQKARKNVDSASMIMDVNEAFVTEISSIIRQVNASTPGCLDYATQINDRPLAKSSGTSALNFTKSLADAKDFAASLSNKERESLHAQLEMVNFQAAGKRCKNPYQPLNPNLANNNVFYLCMTIKQDSTAPVGTFLNSPYAFAEVGWELVNLQTGASMSCSDFANATKAAGAKVFYSVYWAVPVSGSMTVKKHINSFTMGK